MRTPIFHNMTLHQIHMLGCVQRLTDEHRHHDVRSPLMTSGVHHYDKRSWDRQRPHSTPPAQWYPCRWATGATSSVTNSNVMALGEDLVPKPSHNRQECSRWGVRGAARASTLIPTLVPQVTDSVITAQKGGIFRRSVELPPGIGRCNAVWNDGRRLHMPAMKVADMYASTKTYATNVSNVGVQL